MDNVVQEKRRERVRREEEKGKRRGRRQDEKGRKRKEDKQKHRHNDSQGTSYHVRDHVHPVAVPRGQRQREEFLRGCSGVSVGVRLCERVCKVWCCHINPHTTAIKQRNSKLQSKETGQ